MTRRRELRIVMLYVRALILEFRWTLGLLSAAVLVGGALHAVTPLESLAGRRPDLPSSLFAAWMALLGQQAFNVTDVWYLMVVDAVFPLLGLVLIAEGAVRLGLLMFSRRHGEKEWMMVKASTYRDHVVLCGLGNLGFRVLEQLLAQGAEVVALERDPTCRFLAQAKAFGVPVLERDMKDDRTLLDAGVAYARTIVIATNDDMANLEVALDARRLNPKIRVIMRLFDQQIATKIKAAFAVDEAFSASALAAPTVVAMAVAGRPLAGKPEA
jgi:hypothetical protein